VAPSAERSVAQSWTSNTKSRIIVCWPVSTNRGSLWRQSLVTLRMSRIRSQRPGFGLRYWLRGRYRLNCSRIFASTRHVIAVAVPQEAPRRCEKNKYLPSRVTIGRKSVCSVSMVLPRCAGSRTRLAREHQWDTTSAGKSNDISCQNCVRYALQPRSTTVICGDTLMHTAVAESRWWGVR
jgi:hypothetical protein